MHLNRTRKQFYQPFSSFTQYFSCPKQSRKVYSLFSLLYSLFSNNQSQPKDLEMLFYFLYFFSSKLTYKSIRVLYLSLLVALFTFSLFIINQYERIINFLIVTLMNFYASNLYLSHYVFSLTTHTYEKTI